MKNSHILFWFCIPKKALFLGYYICHVIEYLSYVTISSKRRSSILIIVVQHNKMAASTRGHIYIKKKGQSHSNSSLLPHLQTLFFIFQRRLLMCSDEWAGLGGSTKSPTFLYFSIPALCCCFIAVQSHPCVSSEWSLHRVDYVNPSFMWQCSSPRIGHCKLGGGQMILHT